MRNPKSFKQFLNEAIVTKWHQEVLHVKSNKELFDDFMSPAALEAIENGGVLFRGFGKSLGTPKVFVVDPTVGERTSSDTNSSYQMLMDISDDLKDIPSRSKSLICSTSIDDARAYGKPYAMFPIVEHTDVAVSHYSDFLSSSIESKLFSFKSGLYIFYSIIGDILRMVHVRKNQMSNMPRKLVRDEVPQKFIASEVNAYQSIIDGIDPDDFAGIVWGAVKRSAEPLATQDYIEKMAREHQKTFLKDLSKDYTKQNLGISKYKYGDSLPGTKECWMSAPCIAVRLDVFENLVLNMINEPEEFGDIRVNNKYKSL